MERVGEHPVPMGPLAVRWLAYEVAEQRAGVTTTALIRLENAGTAPWRSGGREGVQLAYHWLDPLGNAIVWDGNRTALPNVVAPGETVELESPLVAPRPPGSYRLAFDLVEEFRFWFQEVGSAALDIPVEVRPRIAERRLAVRWDRGGSGHREQVWQVADRLAQRHHEGAVVGGFETGDRIRLAVAQGREPVDDAVLAGLAPYRRVGDGLAPQEELTAVHAEVRTSMSEISAQVRDWPAPQLDERLRSVTVWQDA